MFHWLEKNPFFFAVGVFLVISLAGLIEILPNFAQAARPIEGLKPYSPLEIAGRQVYIKESCNSCHSQLIRPFKSETDRYGKYSLSGEYAYDRPFLWGSVRTGPDLHRVGNYRTSDWHNHHMINPSAIVPGSTMPKYPWLYKKNVDMDTAFAEAFTVKAFFNVPYDQPNMTELEGNSGGDRVKGHDNAIRLMQEQAKKVAEETKNKDLIDAANGGQIKEVVALIAYLNRLK